MTNNLIRSDIEPTWQMLEAADSVPLYAEWPNDAYYKLVWKAMCAAAPKVEVTDEMVERALKSQGVMDGFNLDTLRNYLESDERFKRIVIRAALTAALTAPETK